MNSISEPVHSMMQIVLSLTHSAYSIPKGGVNQKRMKACGVGVQYKCSTYYLCGKYEKHVLYLVTK